MTDFVEICRNEACETFYTPLKETWKSVGDHIEKLEAALQKIRAMHHVGGIDDTEERDDRTYVIVCEALGEKP